MTSWTEREVPLEALMPLLRERLAAGQSVRLSPRGTSMLPMLRQGLDEVVLSPVPARLQKYDLPLYQRRDGQFVLHRVVETGETYTCCGDNQFVLEQGLRRDQMIAVVSSFRRNGRWHRVDALPYRLYCRVWCTSRPIRHFWRRGWGWLRRHLR